MPSNRERPGRHRVENLVSWFSASVLVTLGVIYALKMQEDLERVPSPPPVPKPSPAQEPLALQKKRAGERGRGRLANTPLEIPWRGWKDIVVRTYYDTYNDRLLALAAGVTFYSLVALFPALAAGVSSYALFSDAATIGRDLSVVAD